MAMIEVKGLVKTYGAVKALKGISFSVEKGEIIGLLGRNGAGKTTTMKLLTGYLQPTDGTAIIAGHDVIDDPRAVQSVVGYLPENAPLYLDMAVQEYLSMVADLRDISKEKQKQLIGEAVRSAALTDKLTTIIGNLSKGYRQRVCLAQAILHQPEVLILDEPTNGLDPNQILEIRGLIKRLAEHATIMVSTHILSEVEATCDRAIIIVDGEIQADEQLSNLKTATAALVSVNAEAADVESRLRAVDGITAVQKEGPANGFVRYRVVGDLEGNLCPLIFDAAKQHDWRLSELRQDTKTLESVFHEVSDGKGASA